MPFPRVGVGLPIVGPHASPEAIVKVATAAERLGFHSVSNAERLLLPTPDGWSNPYGLPEYASYDSLEVLTWVAAHTTRIRLGTSILISLFQPPVVLARRLATLDHLSSSRVDVGIAAGWMPEEYAATGVPVAERGRRFEDHLAALRACWGPNPVLHEGPFYPIPRSRIGPKPRNGPLPVFIGGVTKPAIARAARLGDGVVVAHRDWDSTLEHIGWYHEAGGAGPIVLRAGPMLADAQHETPPTAWTEPSVVDDLQRAAEAGVAEVIWDLNIVGRHPDAQIAAFEALAARLSSPVAPA
ncbi:MAG: TIGR03619 family F420-dependent LLM class oxidoreductase [Chloroflexi bacterium]|nr:TIGR03619 family F420-dependent LLM class oxidoreductase [Chloroflexota bacterium]